MHDDDSTHDENEGDVPDVDVDVDGGSATSTADRDVYATSINVPAVAFVQRADDHSWENISSQTLSAGDVGKLLARLVGAAAIDKPFDQIELTSMLSERDMLDEITGELRVHRRGPGPVHAPSDRDLQAAAALVLEVVRGLVEPTEHTWAAIRLLGQTRRAIASNATRKSDVGRRRARVVEIVDSWLGDPPSWEDSEEAAAMLGEDLAVLAPEFGKIATMVADDLAWLAQLMQSGRSGSGQRLSGAGIAARLSRKVGAFGDGQRVGDKKDAPGNTQRLFSKAAEKHGLQRPER